MTTNRPLKVFLCHSSADKPAVRELYQKLRAEPWIQPWLDEEELHPGQTWETEIEKAVESSDVVLVCLSNGSINKRGYVQKELRFALDIALEIPEETIFIIPLRLEECTPPRSLREWQYADYFEGQRDRAFERLLVSLKRCASSLGLEDNSLGKAKKSTALEVHSKFYVRSVHLEYKVNADAKVVNNYLLQQYTGISYSVEFEKTILQVDQIESFNPESHDVFQYGFIAQGYSSTAVNGHFTIGEARMTANPMLKAIPEMFVITISQGQKDISILSFDTDVKHAHMFTTGLVQDLRKAFSVELLNTNQYTSTRKEKQNVGTAKNSSETPLQESKEKREIEKNNGIIGKTKREKHESTKGGNSQEKKSIFNVRVWQGRALIGLLFGVVISIMALIFTNDLLAENELFGMTVICVLAGLITYPHKYSWAFLLLFFFIAALVVQTNFVLHGIEFFVSNAYEGAILGFPVGAIISRFFYWIKVLK